MSNSTYVVVGGYFYSGSSAVVDLLKEYNNCFECGSEIRFINDPYGLIQLEESLTHNWDWIRAAMAIEDYYNLCKKLDRKKNRMPFSPFGMGYRENLNPNFIEITKDFLNRLTEFKYDSDFYAFQAKAPYIEYIINRWRLGIEVYSNRLFKIHKKRMVCHSHPSKKQYYDAVKNYIDQLFEYQVNKQGKEYIILDQAIHPRDSHVISDYFNNGKMVIVDRDPRDMFIQSILTGSMEYNNSEKSGRDYLRLQLSLHEKHTESENILKIQFEDLICNYKSTKKIIENFLGLKPETHSKSLQFFNPEVSKKNVGLWKHYYNDYKKAFDIIAREMADYTFE